MSSYDKNQPRKFTPPFDGRQGSGTGTSRGATGGGGGSSNPGGSAPNDGSQPGDSVNPVNPNKGHTLSDKPIEMNQPPPRQNWQTDMEDWEKDEEPDESLADTCGDDFSTNMLGVQTDFEYENDANGKPDFFVNFFDKVFGERTVRIGYDQTSTHLHHASEIGVPMPAFFEDQKTKDAYIKMDKPERLEYARQNIPVENIIAYQNALGHCVVGKFGLKTVNFPGFAGEFRKDVTIVAQTFPNFPNDSKVKVSVIRENGLHVSTLVMTNGKFNTLMKDPRGFWVFQDKPF